jgi:hypothetical protein
MVLAHTSDNGRSMQRVAEHGAQAFPNQMCVTEICVTESSESHALPKKLFHPRALFARTVLEHLH